MKRKLAAWLLALSLPLCATACGEKRDFTVTATFYPLYTAAINVARGVEGVTVRCLAPPAAGCLHDYQMTAEDRRALENSDAVIKNGLGLEVFLDSLPLPGLVIDASRGLEPLPGHHSQWNPHAWVSVDGMIAQTRNIAEGLAAADPAHAGQYAENGEAYVLRLEALRQEMLEILEPCRGAAIVTFHEAFDYLAEDFGLRVVAVMEEAPGAAPSGRALAALADTIRRENVRALFAEPQYGDASVIALARETGVPAYELDPVATGRADPTDYDAYLRIMEQNARVLAEALP